MIRLLKKYYPSILIALFIMWLSLTDSGKINPGRLFSIPNSDKAGHFVMYMFFTFILLLNSSGWKISEKIKYFIIAVPVILGLSLEFMQVSLTATRQADFYDFVANISGIAFAAVSVLLLRLFMRARQA